MLADPWQCLIEELLLLLVKLASLSDSEFLVDKLSAGNMKHLKHSETFLRTSYTLIQNLPFLLQVW